MLAIIALVVGVVIGAVIGFAGGIIARLSFYEDYD